MKKNQSKGQEEQPNQLINTEPEFEILRKKTLKELIAPAGIDASWKNSYINRNKYVKKFC